ncbi:sulfatase-like hydrolase/transferase [Halapricum sp. CBA1109]|uniref:sulfatase-like hydrolase/transferase n=1 Tax=Halapricum sp. CBA1109 TaxID=2668068 RepID=UPI0012F8C835|nr:sulfatase-like hydrolase/transferase [Halapricum sp. CBA1109]MUV88834.1 sulfatase-like hydrolase/transferase [Halapricum sp. CBA1109]
MDHADRVVLIVLDSVRADALTETTAPNLTARVDSDWLTYENAISPAPWTLPAHASIYTGRLPREHGATAHNKYLSTDHPTLASQFEAAGYHTRLFSNNPFLSETFGMVEGFEEVVLHLDTKLRPDATGLWVADILDRSDSWTETVRTLLASGNRWTPVNLLYELLTLKTDRVGPADDGAERTVDYYLGNDSDGPEFTLCNFMEAHLPYDPPEPFRSRHLPDGATEDDAASVNQEPWDYVLGERDTDFAVLRGLYEGEIATLDAQLERLFEGLEADGALVESLIVVCGDHGDHFGEHGLQGHAGSLHRELLDVPLFVRFPGGEHGGESVSETVSLRQLYSSLLQWTDTPTPEAERAPDPLPMPGEPSTQEGVVAEYMGVQDIDVDPRALEAYDYRRTSVLTADSELIESDDGVDYHDGPTDAETLRGLKSEILDGVPDTVSTGRDGDVPASVRERLEATGYVQ